MVHIAPPGAVKFPMVCYRRKRGTDDGLLGEVSSFLEEICSSLEVVSSSLEVVSACLGRICSFVEEVSSFLEKICSSLGVVSASLGRICSFLEDVSSSTYHCSSGNHCGPVVDLSSDRPPYIYLLLLLPEQ